MSAPLRVLGDASASGLGHLGLPPPAESPRPNLTPEQQLVWLHLIGRCLAALGAARVLRELLAHLAACRVTGRGRGGGLPAEARMRAFGGLMMDVIDAARRLGAALARASAMLAPGGAAAAAASAGSAAAAVDGGDLARLRQQAAELRAALAPALARLLPGSGFSAAGTRFTAPTQLDLDVDDLAAAAEALGALATTGGLARQLAEFGAALAGAFPAPGMPVCGHAGCATLGAELERFNGGATRTCSACKTVRFCSTAHQRAAWRVHKAACAVLPAAAPAGAGGQRRVSRWAGGGRRGGREQLGAGMRGDGFRCVVREDSQLLPSGLRRRVGVARRTTLDAPAPRRLSLL